MDGKIGNDWKKRRLVELIVPLGRVRLPTLKHSSRGLLSTLPAASPPLPLPSSFLSPRFPPLARPPLSR
eukprot:9439151-Prorocentrum_lima.AAC.1